LNAARVANPKALSFGPRSSALTCEAEASMTSPAPSREAIFSVPRSFFY
jgi:hypothetical protein